MKCLACFLLCAVLPTVGFAQGASPNAISAMGYRYPEPVAVAPGQLITVFVQGSLPSDISVTLRQSSDVAVPVLAVLPTPSYISPLSAPAAPMTAITQIAYEIGLPCLACALPYAGSPPELFVTANGAAGALFPFDTQTDRIHILTACDTVVPSGSGYALSERPCSPLVTHADGSPVTPGNPAQGRDAGDPAQGRDAGEPGAG
jgi:hypothetical protein